MSFRSLAIAEANLNPMSSASRPGGGAPGSAAARAAGWAALMGALREPTHTMRKQTDAMTVDAPWRSIEVRLSLPGRSSRQEAPRVDQGEKRRTAHLKHGSGDPGRRRSIVPADRSPAPPLPGLSVTTLRL